MGQLDMDYLLRDEVYNVDNPNLAIFYSAKEPLFELSNMCTGMPIKVECNGEKLIFNSSEALYQACKYPPELEVLPKSSNATIANVRERIIKAKTPMQAKMTQKCAKKFVRKDWEDIKIDVMLWVLKLKARQHLRFAEVLCGTDNKIIVEKSKKDLFWGAVLTKDGTLKGKNVLGKLLMYVRSNIKEIITKPLEGNYLLGC